MLIGGDFVFLLTGGDLDCILEINDVFFFFFFIIFIIVSCFTCATLIIDLYYEVIHDIYIYIYFFFFCETKNLFCFYLYLPHMRLCVC